MSGLKPLAGMSPLVEESWARTQEAGYVGPFGAWAGDDAEGPEEVAAATVHPSVLSHVIAGERLKVKTHRPKLEEVGLKTEDSRIEDSRPEVSRPDARSLAFAPVSEAVRRAHEAAVLRTYGPVLPDEFEIELGFNPTTGAFDALMRGDVMQTLRELGPVVKVKGRF